MNKEHRFLKIYAALFMLWLGSSQLHAQVLEWRLANSTYSSVDPDGAGPGQGSATFTLQIHAITGTANNINTISLGWSYQSSKAILPASVTGGCLVGNNPSNVVISSAFAAAGFFYTSVNQCGIFSQTTGGQTYDRRAVGTLDGSSINVSTTWVDVFTVTLWSTSTTVPEAGYVIINSAEGGTPAPFNTYAVANVLANQFAVNSLTYATALPLGSAPLPVTLSRFEGTCTGTGALLKWQTATEENTDRYEIERSDNGNSGWSYVSTIKAAGNSSSLKKYEFTDVPTRGTTIFYRLRSIDKDGKFSYSPVVKVNCDNKMPDLYVYPVPAKNVLYINLTTKKNSKASIKVLDVAGKVYQVFEKDVQKGFNKLTLNVAGLSSGEYILKVEEDHTVQFKQILIL